MASNYKKLNLTKSSFYFIKAFDVLIIMFPLHLSIKTLTVNFVSGLNLIKHNQELRHVPNELYLYMLAI